MIIVYGNMDSPNINRVRNKRKKLDSGKTVHLIIIRAKKATINERIAYIMK